MIKNMRPLQKTYSKPVSTNLVAEDGTSLQNDKHKLNRWVKHFKGVVNWPVDVIAVSIDDIPIVSSLSNSCPSNDELSIPLSEEEIKSAISQLRSEKAPDIDEIFLEMLSLGEDVTIQWLKSIFGVIWATELVPSDWQSQLLVPLHEKGSHTICDNYSGNSILSIPGKVLAKAILNRLKPRAEQLLRESQCGFLCDRSCADQLVFLRQLMEKARQYHHPVYACFIIKGI